MIRSERILMTMLGCALTCVVLSLGFGALSALCYFPGVSAKFGGVGLSLVQLRPLHTTFASAWIFVGAAACAYKYLFDTFGEPTTGDRKRFKFHMVLWGLAGIATLLTLPFGITSGREYLGFHPVVSLLILVGWVAFAWTFLSKVRHGFFRRPVYVQMWSVGILYFIWTFLEGHAYLLPAVRSHPIADLQIQWKSCGTLVAAFNQMVYASLIYMGEKRANDPRIGQSRTAYGLFWIGLLNSFTNYAHHTYHLPQSHIIKWTAFGVSMLEIILLARMFHELAAAMRAKDPKRPAAYDVTGHFLGLSKNWNLFLLSLALIISVPPWNAFIHGTHVVMAHAMGSELAIDSYVLLGAVAFILGGIFTKWEVRDQILHTPGVSGHVNRINVSLIGLVILLLGNGLVTGYYRYLGMANPTWLDVFPLLLVGFGSFLAIEILGLLRCWLPLFRDPRSHKALLGGAGPWTRAASGSDGPEQREADHQPAS